ncbi:MAG: phosphoribosylanthranilate isomerase [Planctomycetaceae bacterium]|nr:phosphoribosylanthranilate isomerase [Planctomycetaceae bacterium]
MTSTWIKICGITQTDDAVAVALSGAGAIGLNFFPKSRRFVDIHTAERISREIAGRVECVGVFVNVDVADVVRTVQTVGLTGVQFHGDETLEYLQQCRRELPTIDLIRAFRLSRERVTDVAAQLGEIVAADIPLKAVLLDTFVSGEFGGTGLSMDLTLPDDLRQRVKSQLPASVHFPPVVLAGGLTAENVSAAIQRVQPWGVDTAGGVESSAGVKDHDKIRDFVTQVRSTERGDDTSPS